MHQPDMRSTLPPQSSVQNMGIPDVQNDILRNTEAAINFNPPQANFDRIDFLDDDDDLRQLNLEMEGPKKE